MTASVTLRDGRRLAYREYGTPSGYPVLFFHGNLNTRLYSPMWAETESATDAAGARLIAVDRPGVGGSDPHAGRTYATWAQDIADFVLALDLRRFAVLGYSSGGVHAIALAACSASGGLLGERLAAVGLVSADGPYWLLGQQKGGAPWLRAKALTPEVALKVCKLTEQNLAESYKKLRPDRRSLALADLAEAVVQGHEGPAQDTHLETNDWGIDFQAAARFGAEGRRLLLWHGEEDHDVDVRCGRFLAGKLGLREGDAAIFVSGETHSMVRRRWPEFLRATIAAASAAAARL